MPETKPKKYANPPILEAVFDLHIQGGKPFDSALFKDIPQKVKGYTPHGFLQNVNINVQDNSHNIEKHGCRYISQDKKKITAFRNNGFSFSRLAVYDGWGKNYKEAENLWDIYFSIIEPQAIVRISTRFINKFNIPGALTNPEEYFNMYVHYDKSISPVWNQNSCRILFSHNNGARSHIVFDVNINQNSQSADVTLDIDVFSDNLALGTENKEALKNIFENIREIKNDIFEKIITDKVREMIK